MRIAVFSDSINIPPKEGINVHTYDLLRTLASKPDCNPVLIVCDRGWLDHSLLQQQMFDTILLPEKEFYSVKYISNLLKKYEIDIAQSYMTYFGSEVLGPAAFDAEVPCIAELHDLEESVVGVYFSDSEIAEATKTHVSFQKKAAQFASVVRVMSQYDYSIIQREWSDFDSRRYVCIPVSRPAVNVVHRSTPNTITYIGNMSYSPNAQGAEIIRDKIAPMLDRPINFIGRGSEQFNSKYINALGMVDDIEPLLVQTAVGISPIIQGSGMKIKNLTYLSHGIPLLATTLGARGFLHSDAIIIEDDFGLWPGILLNLLHNHEQRSHLSKVASAYFSKNFEISTTTERLLSVYQHAIDSYKVNRSDLRVRDTETVHPIDMKNVYWLRELRESAGKKCDVETYVRGKGK